MKTYPKISIVTPSFNQAEFLEGTIQSVLGQGYPNLEYIIIDGGSTDGSKSIIEKYASNLAYWCSEPDGGQYSAINKGFAKATGEVMAWINSDDLYFGWTFREVASVFSKFSEVKWITSLYPCIWSKQGTPVVVRERDGFHSSFFAMGYYMSRGKGLSRGYIQQESTFWRRDLWLQAGGHLSERFSLAGDFELWSRFFAFAELVGVGFPAGGSRQHGAQRSNLQRAAYEAEVEQIFRELGGGYRGCLDVLIRRLHCYRRLPKFFPGSRRFVREASNIRWDSKEHDWSLLRERIT